jgi:DNA-binding LacI/PurR family transcriptional regulator
MACCKNNKRKGIIMQKKKERNQIGCQYVTAYLSEQIRDNIYPPGAKLPSMKELAAKFQVSDSTIKNAFRRLKSEKLLRYHSGVGMIVREDLKFPLKIALILPDDYGNLKELLMGIQEALKACAGSIEIMFYQNVIEQEECLKRLENEDFSGAVIYPDLSKQGYGLIRKFQDEAFPLVLIENFYPESNGWHVDAGAFETAEIAVGYLKDIGHLPIGMVCPDNKLGNSFVEGYKNTHVKLKEDCRRSNIRRVEYGMSVAKISVEFMKMKAPPHSIIYTSPPDAMAGYKALKEHGFDLRCIKLLSFGEALGFEFLEHPIVSIKRDFKKLGRKAGNLLIEQIKIPKDKRHHGKTEKVTPSVGAF